MSKAIRATESSKRKKKMEKKKIDRRKFLKTFGVGAAAATAGLYGCKTKGTAPSAAAAGEVPTDRMTFRTCPSTGDRVSLLGYGCMPCPYGLDIPAIFAHYNRCVNEGNVPKDRQDPGYREARRAFLIGYDRSVPKLRQASHCIGCNQCVSHCPQSIKIPQQLRRIDRFVEQLKQGTL